MRKRPIERNYNVNPGPGNYDIEYDITPNGKHV